MAKKGESFNNLIDEYLKMVEDPGHPGNVGEQFVNLLINYFFNQEKNENRSVELLLAGIQAPPFLASAATDRKSVV